MKKSLNQEDINTLVTPQNFIKFFKNNFSQNTEFFIDSTEVSPLCIFLNQVSESYVYQLDDCYIVNMKNPNEMFDIPEWYIEFEDSFSERDTNPDTENILCTVKEIIQHIEDYLS